MTSLNRLYLNNNQLSGNIPSELGNLTGLNYLWLGDNQLTGYIPDEITNLINLYDGNGLYIDNNHLCTEDDTVKAFVDLKAGSGWDDTQTETPCDPEPIPAINEWGMIALACLFIFFSFVMMRDNKRFSIRQL